MSKRKTPGRDASGKFKSGDSGGAKKSRKRKSTAIVGGGPRTVVVRENVTIANRSSGKPAKRRGGSRVGGELALAADPVKRVKSKAPDLIGSVVYGWITNGDAGSTAGTLKAYLDKVPTIEAIGKPATHGLILTFLASKTSGKVRRYLDIGATAALHRFAYNLGSKAGNFALAAAVGEDDSIRGVDDLSGAIDIDPLAGDDAGYDDDDASGDDLDD